MTDHEIKWAEWNEARVEYAEADAALKEIRSYGGALAGWSRYRKALKRLNETWQKIVGGTTSIVVNEEIE